MNAVRDLQEDMRGLKEDVRKGNEKRDQQHTELLALIRSLQGSSSQSRRDDPPFDDPDFTPRDRPGGHHDDPDPDTGRGGIGPMETASDHTGPGTTERGHVGGGTQTAVQEEVLAQDLTVDDSSQLQHDHVHLQDLTHVQSSQLLHDPSLLRSSRRSSSQNTSTADPPHRSSRRSSSDRSSTADPPLHRSSRCSSSPSTPTGDPPLRRSSKRSSSDRSDPMDLDRSPQPQPLRRSDRDRRPGWQERSPYTDPCRPKRPRTMPVPPHVWAPNELVHLEQLSEYEAYKKSESPGEL